MKKAILPALAGLVLTTGVLAQTSGPDRDKKSAKARNNAVALSFSFPIGNFNRSHTAGITADYSYAGRRYGNEATLSRLFSFVVNAGASYHVGKSNSTSGYEFRYGGYFTVYAAAGIDYKPAVPISISLTSGPAMSIYEGTTEVGAGINLFWNYLLSKKIALGPGLVCRKFAKTDALWSGTIRASYAF